MDRRCMMMPELPHGPIGLESFETFAQGLDHPEGIAIDHDGTIYTGGEAGQLYRIGADETPHEIGNTGGFALGLALDAEGRLYACDDVRAAVLRLDPSGVVEVFSAGSDSRAMRVPNWGAFDTAGNYYVSDSGEWAKRDGLLWVVRPGRRAEVWTEETSGFPNGLAVAPDGSRVYLMESMPARIVEIPIDDDGSAGPVRVLCDLGLFVPDGVAVAADGSLVLACYRPDAIYRWNAGDGLDLLAYDPQGQVLNAPTNVAFGGDDLDLMVFPNLCGWHLTRGRVEGLRGTPLFRPTADQLGG
jgi:gluconolactonase